jgi:hypothetical protein
VDNAAVMMTSFVRLTWAAAAFGALLDSGAALADEVRDHRTPAPAPAPVVRDHRTEPGAPAVVDQPRYRRRPGPRYMLPLKIDLGMAGASTSRGYAPGIGGAIGVHWASLSPTPTNTDVGIGVFGAWLGAPKDPMMMTSDTVAYGGAYLELGHTLSHGDWWRTWASGRGEYVSSTAFGEDHKGYGGSGRLSAELFASGVGIEPRGLFLGTYALGVYLEAGVRDVAPGLSDFHIGAGITIRTPFVFAP